MQTVDLQTGQNVTITYELATLGERLLALLLDLLIFFGGFYLLMVVLDGVFGITTAYGGIIFVVLPLIVFLFGQFLCELYLNGQTVGKRALRIQVVRLDGEQPTAGDYLLRSMFYFVDLFSSGGVLGALLISVGPRKQRIGDLTAGTNVIRVEATEKFLLSDIQKISSLENYEPQYPQVRQFTEADMLLIKTALTRAMRYNNDNYRTLLRELAQRLAQQLEITHQPLSPAEFLKVLLKDYIVLTR
ncbi:MAG: RDD family protein [Bacteroidota bacterium]